MSRLIDQLPEPAYVREKKVIVTSRSRLVDILGLFHLFQANVDHQDTDPEPSLCTKRSKCSGTGHTTCMRSFNRQHTWGYSKRH